MALPRVAKAEAKDDAGERQRACHNHTVLMEYDLLQTLGHGAGDTAQSIHCKHEDLSLVPGTCMKNQAQWLVLEMPALKRRG